ncbi:MAG: ATP-binding protein, partial [Anaerovibrio sp.]|nr:ATP-binding protein [Anaerovibrio sp.]
MKTVTEACIPHQGLIDGTLNLEVFTAALGPVIDFYHQKGTANIDKVYTDAEIFFREATYPTDGLKQLVGNVFRRIDGDMTADSVMKLETAFGGGKTHSLISCVHIAYRGKEIEEATKGIIDSAYLPEPGTVSVVGIAGDELPVRKTQGDKLSPYTIWGEMALQLGGEALYQEVKAEAESYASPGKAFFEKVLGARKVILMFDELAQYASRLDVVLPGQGADQLSAFLMALNNYAQNHTGIAVIVTLASAKDAFAKQTEALSQKLNEIVGTSKYTKSDAEAIAQRANKSASSVISRSAKVVTPVQASEIAHILAKRLFTSIDMSVAQEVSRAYGDMYAKNASLLPEEANMANFAKRMVENYPFHPTFIDYLNNKLSLAEDFQGTRGVLRVLALTIRDIWQKKMPISLIHTCNVDMRNAITVDEILGRTGSADLKTALNADVGSVETASLGSGLSQAERADKKNPHPDGLPMYELTWKTVFLNSLVARGEGKTAKAFGINQQDAIFMISSPVLPPAQVKIALEEITHSAFYLRYEDGKYFAHQNPTLNSVLAQIRENVNSKRIHQKLKSLAGTLLADNHLFSIQQDVRLPQDIPDNNTKPTVAVIALDAKEIDPMKLLQEKGENTPRVHQNMVVMLIPSTVKVILSNMEQTLLGEETEKAHPLSYVEDLARQVIAINDLKDKPTAYGINAHKLED